MKKTFVQLMVAWACCFMGVSAPAQPAITRTATLRDANLWLQGNPAGLIYNNNIRFSTAEAGYHFTSGNFRQPFSPPALHRYQVSSESFFRLKKVFLHGKIGYTQEIRKQQQWSAMLQPEAHLINFGDSIPGQRSAETYTLCGAIGVPLNQHWSIGTSLNYHARSYKKKTDPSNNNMQTDFLCSPGITYNRPRLRLGANLIYHRIVEDIDYSSVDAQAQETQILYPLWFYITETLDGGLNKQQAYQDDRLGGAIQFHFGNTHREWYNEIRYIGSTEKTDKDILHGIRTGETRRREFNYTGHIRLRSSLCHSWQPRYHHLSLTGYDNLQDYPDNNAHNQIENYGHIKRSAAITDEASLTYTLSRPADTLNNRWTIHSGIAYHREESVFLIYPARFFQPVTRLSYTAGYSRRIHLRHHLLECSGRLSYSTAHGSFPSVRSEDNASLPNISIPQNQKLAWQDFHFLTAETLRAAFHLQYTYPITATCAFFSTAIADYTRALSANCRGDHRQTVHFAAGILF